MTPEVLLLQLPVGFGTKRRKTDREKYSNTENWEFQEIGNERRGKEK
jgi:hypothetical protein